MPRPGKKWMFNRPRSAERFVHPGRPLLVRIPKASNDNRSSDPYIRFKKGLTLTILLALLGLVLWQGIVGFSFDF